MILRLWPLSIIFYADNLPDGVGGRANGPVVRIRPKYKTDAGLEAHELEHVAQWWMTFGLHSILYLFRPYRLWAESRAYKTQAQYPDRTGHFMTLDEAAVLLADSRYDLGLSAQDARACLAAIKIS